MALPDEVSMSRVVDSYVGFDGEPATGQILFFPTATELRASSGVTVLKMNEPLVGEVVEGALDVEIPATDDPDLTPTGWGYVVVEKFVNRNNDPAYTILAPGSGVILSEAAPVVPIEELAGQVLSVNGNFPDSSGNVTVTVAGVDVSWDDVDGKPVTFPPSAHTHVYDSLTGLPEIPETPGDIGAQPAGDYVLTADLIDVLDGISEDLDGKSDAGHTHSYAAITDKPVIPATPGDIGAQPAGDYATQDDLTPLVESEDLAAVAFSGSYEDLDDLPEPAAPVDLNSRLAFVDVVTGEESRPTATRVFWIGGNQMPENIEFGDVWMKQEGM